MLEKAATIKRFEYSLLGKELKAKIDIAEKQHQIINNTFKFARKKKKSQHLQIIINQI